MVDANIHTINLGKVTLSQSQHRAVRAINMIREYVQKHKNTSRVKIDQELAHLIWKRGVRRPPRKVTVEIIDDGGDVLVLPYSEPVVEELPPLKEDAATAIDAKETPIEDAGVAPAKALPDVLSNNSLDDELIGDVPEPPDSSKHAYAPDAKKAQTADSEESGEPTQNRH